jgi:hypothetical protein
MSRNTTFGVLAAIIAIALVELESWAFVSLAMRFSALRFYPSDVFSRMTDDQLARAASQGPLGWPANDSPRAAPSGHRPVCGSAFGDSMTYGAEVEDDEAWVHLVSLGLGCTVANYAVPAYGIDQTVLRYERIATEGKFVILGLFLEMIRRSVAASWTFYAPAQPMEIHQIKPYFNLDGEGFRLHPIPQPLTRQTIAAHHAGDYYMRDVGTAATFPYTLSAGRAIYLRLFRTDDYRRHTEKFLDPAHPSGSGVLARRLIDRFARTAHSRGARLVIVLFPSMNQLLVDNAQENRFADDLSRGKETCLIDLKPMLREHARLLGGKIPTAPKGHYTALGNRWIADAVAAGLETCGIAPA